jgi:hypothetical protein
MWLLNYLVCLVRKHIFAAITMSGSAYNYCLRCGRVEHRDTLNGELNIGK